MKKTFFRPLWAGLLLMGLTGCQHKIDLPLLMPSLTVLQEDQTFSLTTPENLREFIKNAIGRADVAVTEATLQEAEDEAGKFFVLSGSYEATGKSSSVSIYLTPAEEARQTAEAGLVRTSCIMQCTSNAACHACRQNIQKRCQQQSCQCISGTGTSTASVIYVE